MTAETELHAETMAAPDAKVPKAEGEVEHSVDNSSVYAVLADTLDTVLGFKDHPERLQLACNLCFFGLFYIVYQAWLRIPPGEFRTASDVVHLSLRPADVIASARAITKSQSLMSWLIAGFGLQLFLCFAVVNFVGGANIRAFREEQAKKRLTTKKQ